jgi:SprA family protein
MISPIASARTSMVVPQRSDPGEAHARSGFSPLPSAPGEKPPAPAPAIKEKPNGLPTVGRPLLSLDNEQFAALQNERGFEDGNKPEKDQSSKDANKLSPEEEEVVTKLQRRDTEVRRHERAHASAGGAHTGAPSYQFQTGPDGQRYAVGGEVAIDTAPVRGNLKATIVKMEQVKSAALAPANPSGQDRAVASAAEASRLQAEAALREQKADEASEVEEPEEIQRGFAETDEALHRSEPRRPTGRELNISV